MRCTVSLCLEYTVVEKEITVWTVNVELIVAYMGDEIEEDK